jgi:glycerol-3-phosphate dehydrogenase (NAD(P)+)
VDRIARERGVDMPVTHEVTRVLFDGLTAADAVQDLLAREPKSERG